MGKEDLSKIIGSVFSTIINQNQWNKNTLQISIKQLLLNKRQRTVSQNEFMDVLLRNIAFFYDYTNEAKSFIEHAISIEEFPSIKSFEDYMFKAREKVNDPENLIYTMESLRRHVYQGNTIAEQVSNAEIIYTTYKIVNDLFLDFVSIFLHTENRQYMSELLEYNSNIVVEQVSNYCKTYASLYLDDMVLDYQNEQKLEMTLNRLQLSGEIKYVRIETEHFGKGTVQFYEDNQIYVIMDDGEKMRFIPSSVEYLNIDLRDSAEIVLEKRYRAAVNTISQLCMAYKDLEPQKGKELDEKYGIELFDIKFDKLDMTSSYTKKINLLEKQINEINGILKAYK